MSMRGKLPLQSSERMQTATILALFFVGLFLIQGVFLPYWPVWLKAQGLSAGEIGILLSLPNWVRVFADPLIAQRADHTGNRKTPMMWLAGIYVLTVLAFPVSSNFWWLAGLSVVIGFTFSPLLPLGTTITVHECKTRDLDYGRVRLWGSLAFIFASYGAGWVLDGTSTTWIVWMLFVAGIVNFAITTRMPDPQTDRSLRSGSSLIYLLRKPVFLIYLGCIGFAQGSHGTYYSFASVHWETVGYSHEMIGTFWSIGVIAEIALFAVAGKFVRGRHPGILFALGATAGIVRWIVLGSSDAFWMIVLVQPLHAMTFGITHLAAVSFIARAIPQQLATSAQSLMATLSMGVFLGSSIWASGPLYEHFGSHAYYAMAGLSGIALVFAFWLMQSWRGEDKTFCD
ncbi:MAG: 3-phenylpropionate MFS transporter [Thalassospira sp.]|uniref:MFS transporter n=1 Tax=Thalassospira sp. GB04J01 TaxID=1485225 RepID=UPI000C10EF1A|nr:MFS transporter [Thalassospira sp. GB04J01]MBV17910.1 3-phenylpropionate MFS transporter [Thalassospira sp.]|tara:strand:+ start:191303 stop:192499 length:1197 start_codon:yes stop_codon:yes gene_type:complete